MRAEPDAFYVPDRDRFVSTRWTAGPWDERSQHAGPVCALAGRAIEALEAPAPMRVARLTLEILRPVPVAPLGVEARLVRPGGRVQYAEAHVTAGGEEVARAAAWRIRVAPEPVAPEVALGGAPPPGPEGIAPFVPERIAHGGRAYGPAMEWRFARGAFFEPGPAAAWMRMRVALVAGEEPTPLQRVLAAADSGNGISMVLPLPGSVFINTEITVHLAREPVDEWVCVDACSRIAPDGIGLSESTLWDRRGRIGGGRQSLYVDRRGAPSGAEPRFREQ